MFADLFDPSISCWSYPIGSIEEALRPMNLTRTSNGIRGIVFDAVGTLIKPVPSVAESYTLAARRQGVELDTEEVRLRFHVHFQSDEVHGSQGVLSTDEATECRRWRRIVAGVLPEVPDPESAFDELWDHFSRPDSWQCYADVAPVLDVLAANEISVCVGSNFDSRLRGVVRGLPELRTRIDCLVISSEVGFRKPHPTFFQAVCAELRLPAARVLCVGDDPENDVRGAIRAGLSGLLLDRGVQAQGDLPHVPNLTAVIERKFGEP
jgi:putative hydrolase of the HAD superfamily